MRLLRLGEQDELILEEFNYKLPPYAILSHTWTAPEEEYTFQDVHTQQGKHKRGYEKILFVAKQSQLDGLAHFWIDTCCIDLTSSAELSEAVNSTFRWYQNAYKCYVHLADVQKEGFGEQFRQSRWFTRGWTLQELLAPKEIEFFSHDWQSLGTKELLEGEIHKITGIPLRALQGCPLSDFSVEERISWIQDRRTTRAEDMAYSLLGILGVAMPVIYGEGEDMAFRRLRRELRELEHDPVESLKRSKNKDFMLNESARKDSGEAIREEDEKSELEYTESIFSDTGVSMSSKSSIELNPIRVSGIREITRVFLSREDFRSLCTTAISGITARKVRAHIRGLLKAYGQRLDREAQSPLQHRAAKFVQEVAGRIADEIRWSITGFEEVRRPESTAQEKPNLEKWLSAIGEGETEEAERPAPTDNHDSDDDESEDDLNIDETFPNIDAVKEFLLSSTAFGSLLHEFEDWASVRKPQNSTTRHTANPAPQILFNESLAHVDKFSSDHMESIPSDKDETSMPNASVIETILSTQSRFEKFSSFIWRHFDFRGAIFSFIDLVDLFIPPPSAGSQRIRWRCTCNTVLCADFHGADSQALAQLKEDLLNDLSSSTRSPRTGFPSGRGIGGFSNTLGEQQSPGHEKFDHGSPTSRQTTIHKSADSSSFGGGQTGDRSESTPGSSHPTASSTQRPVDLTGVAVDRSKLIYFEVCTNIDNSAVGHFELDITGTTTDGELFEKIWDTYNRNRGIGLRRFFLRPCDVHFVLFSISALKTTRYSAGIHAKPAEYPPDRELQHRRYHYHTPKLMMPPHIFLHYLHRARLNVWGDHANDTWLKRLPKKLHESILAAQASGASPDSDLVFGWGVHILDGPNHAVLGFFLVVALMVTFIISCLIVGIAKTQEQAFGVGSYLIAIVVALMSAVYFKLQDQ